MKGASACAQEAPAEVARMQEAGAQEAPAEAACTQEAGAQEAPAQETPVSPALCRWR